jgi:hypothetical protein
MALTIAPLQEVCPNVPIRTHTTSPQKLGAGTGLRRCCPRCHPYSPRGCEVKKLTRERRGYFFWLGLKERWRIESMRAKRQGKAVIPIVQGKKIVWLHFPWREEDQ